MHTVVDVSKMRKLATNTEHADEVDNFIAELRQTYRRRPQLQLEFVRCVLP